MEVSGWHHATATAPSFKSGAGWTPQTYDVVLVLTTVKIKNVLPLLGTELMLSSWYPVTVLTELSKVVILLCSFFFFSQDSVVSILTRLGTGQRRNHCFRS